MRGLQLTLTQEDFKILTDCLLNSKLTALNKKRLYQELREARVVDRERLPLNVVCKNAKVLVWNMDKQQTFTVRIVSPEEFDENENCIPMDDPIAIALLGYPSGAITEWEMPDGVNRFKVVSVSQSETGSATFIKE